MPNRILKKTIHFLDRFVPQRFQPLWHHPAGPRTIFFWAPAFKWGIVIADIGDIHRPPEKVSVDQHLSVGVSATIWTRYSMVIKPKNYSLFSVNAFLAVASFYQVARAVRYQWSLDEPGQ